MEQVWAFIFEHLFWAFILTSILSFCFELLFGIIVSVSSLYVFFICFHVSGLGCQQSVFYLLSNQFYQTFWLSWSVYKPFSHDYLYVTTYMSLGFTYIHITDYQSKYVQKYYFINVILFNEKRIIFWYRKYVVIIIVIVIIILLCLKQMSLIFWRSVVVILNLRMIVKNTS